MRNILWSFTFLLGFVLCFLGAGSVFAQEETIEARVDEIISEGEIIFYDGSSQMVQELGLTVIRGSIKGSRITLKNGDVQMPNVLKYKVGDNLVISFSKNSDGSDNFFIVDYVRRKPMLRLFILFIMSAVIIGRWKGVGALVGMILSFGIVFRIVLPMILAGKDPVLSAIIGSFLIIPATFFVSHGINKKTFIAMVGTVITLAISGFLADMFVRNSYLTGFSSEEANFLQIEKQGQINMKDLLIAGIIIGMLGVMDDITVSQAAIVEQLKKTSRELSVWQIYRKAMDIGKDHIASMINTLILVYAGAVMPLLLLFINNPKPFVDVINMEIVSEEVIRTLVGSIGLILAVPITTFLAARSYKN